MSFSMPQAMKAARTGKRKKEQTLKGYAFEEMRAEMFSMLAGAMLHLPMPESNSAAYINFWNQKFSGGDSRPAFQSASGSRENADSGLPVSTR